MTLTRPRNWSTDEETLLLQQLKDGMSAEDIAKDHSRSVGALVVRRKLIALRMHNEGRSRETILDITKVTTEELDAQIAYAQKKKKPKAVTLEEVLEGTASLVESVRDLEKRVKGLAEANSA